MIRKILVPVDGSEHSKTALEFACELCKRFEAELSVLHVVRNELANKPVMALGSAYVMVPADPEKIEAAGRSVIEAAEALIEEHGCRMSSSEVVAGIASAEILASAQRGSIDTIVMGSRGLSDLGGLLLGSVSHKVSHLAKCTCIVVR